MRQWRPVQIAILALAAILFLVNATAASPAFLTKIHDATDAPAVFWAKPAATGWTVDLIADGLGGETSPVFVADCQVNAPTLHAPAGGAAIVQDLGAWQCSGSSWGVLQVPDARGLILRAAYAPTGAVLYTSPAAPIGATGGSAGGLQNGGENATYVLLFVDRPGTVTIIARGPNGDEVGRDFPHVDASLVAYVPVSTPFPVGSVEVRPGFWPAEQLTPCLTCGPSRIYAWATSGPLTGRVAPRAVPVVPAP